MVFSFIHHYNLMIKLGIVQIEKLFVLFLFFTKKFSVFIIQKSTGSLSSLTAVPPFILLLSFSIGI